jgi:hypothetical protein
MSIAGINLAGAKPFSFPIPGVTAPLPFTPPATVIENKKKLEEVTAQFNAVVARAETEANAAADAKIQSDITKVEIAFLTVELNKINNDIDALEAHDPLDPLLPGLKATRDGFNTALATLNATLITQNNLYTTNLQLAESDKLLAEELGKEKALLELQIAAGVSAAESKRLGGGLKGIAPKPANVNTETEGVATNRLLLREAWNTTTYLDALGNTNRRIITPFRAVNNAGDVLSRKNYSCGGACQTPQSRPGVYGLKSAFGAVQSICDETLVPPAACNVRYVYDSSDYTRYLKERAVNKNYNDYSNVGNDYNASQVSFRSSKRGFF